MGRPKSSSFECLFDLESCILKESFCVVHAPQTQHRGFTPEFDAVLNIINKAKQKTNRNTDDRSVLCRQKQRYRRWKKPGMCGRWNRVCRRFSLALNTRAESCGDLEHRGHVKPRLWRLRCYSPPNTSTPSPPNTHTHFFKNLFGLLSSLVAATLDNRTFWLGT